MNDIDVLPSVMKSGVVYDLSRFLKVRSTEWTVSRDCPPSSSLFNTYRDQTNERLIHFIKRPDYDI